MKIASVETYLLRFPVDPGRYGASSKGWIRDRSSLLVRVRSDDGVEGWGEGGQTGPPEDIRGYLEVKDRLRIPISGGEVEYTSFGARELIAQRAVDIIQPDTCGCGGITECVRIAALARAFGVQYFPHVWGSAVGLAASLHLMAALPPCPPTGNPSPYYQEPLLEFDRNPSPLRDELTREAIRFANGVVAVPQGPGLGITLNPVVLERHRVA
jgi:D-galactarolactone cycloisomerase